MAPVDGGERRRENGEIASEIRHLTNGLEGVGRDLRRGFTNVDVKLEALDKRLDKLETWKTYVLGAFATLTVVLAIILKMWKF